MTTPQGPWRKPPVAASHFVPGRTHTWAPLASQGSTCRRGVVRRGTSVGTSTQSALHNRSLLMCVPVNLELLVERGLACAACAHQSGSNSHDLSIWRLQTQIYMLPTKRLAAATLGLGHMTLPAATFLVGGASASVEVVIVLTVAASQLGATCAPSPVWATRRPAANKTGSMVPRRQRIRRNCRIPRSSSAFTFAVQGRTSGMRIVTTHENAVKGLLP